MPKTPAKPQSAQRTPPPPRGRSKTTMIIAVVVVAILAVAYVLNRRAAEPAATAAVSSATDSTAATPPTPAASDQQAASAVPASNEAPASAKFGPHTQASYPPLPETGFPPPRPAETVRAVYQFAAEHPEVLSYIPCYCGCDRQGHKGNDDCFVAERSPNGDVRAWDSHGST